MECIAKVSEQTLDLAKELAQKENSQVALRAAVGRAYYSAFYLGEVLARKCPIPKDVKGGMHEKVICGLEQVHQSSFGSKKTSEDIRRIGSWLRKVRALRVIADYELENDVSIESYQIAERTAKKIVRDSLQVLNQLDAA